MNEPTEVGWYWARYIGGAALQKVKVVQGQEGLEVEAGPHITIPLTLFTDWSPRIEE